MSSVLFSGELLQLASIVLRDSDYVLSRTELRLDETKGRESELLIAENSFFILAIAATTNVGELRAVESAATKALADRITQQQLGGKIWDVYLVLLSSQASQDDRQAVLDTTSLSHNTRNLRRIVRWDVRPSLESMNVALRAFLPLQQPVEQYPLEDPMTELEAELQNHGVDARTASRAVAAFRQTGTLRDV